MIREGMTLLMILTFFRMITMIITQGISKMVSKNTGMQTCKFFKIFTWNLDLKHKQLRMQLLILHGKTWLGQRIISMIGIRLLILKRELFYRMEWEIIHLKLLKDGKSVYLHTWITQLIKYMRIQYLRYQEVYMDMRLRSM